MPKVDLLVDLWEEIRVLSNSHFKFRMLIHLLENIYLPIVPFNYNLKRYLTFPTFPKSDIYHFSPFQL